MADPRHLEKLQEGLDSWNEWRRRHPHIRPDLSGADLKGRRLCKNEQEDEPAADSKKIKKESKIK